MLESVGEFLVKGVVGEGGMGVVYEGLQPVIGKRVAIKLLKPRGAADPIEAQRLLDEARLVNTIGHRGIIDIFSFGQLDDGRQYLVMEYLSGVPLSRHLRAHAPLPPQDVLKILDEILAAIGAAHDQGVVHRDLKPSNVFLVVQSDGSSYVKVLDFGLAKRGLFSQGEVAQTSASHVMGTPEFMAPEQLRGEPVSPRTDLYSVGVLAFELLTGRLPFTDPSVALLIRKHLHVPPPAPSSVVPDVPPELDALVLKLLEKQPAARPKSAEVVRQQIRAIRAARKLEYGTRFVVPPAVEQPSAAAPKKSAAPAWALPGGEVKFERAPQGRSAETVVKPSPSPPPRRAPPSPPRAPAAPAAPAAPVHDTDRMPATRPTQPITRPVTATRTEWLYRLASVGVGALCVLLVQLLPGGAPPPAPQPLSRDVLVDAAPLVVDPPVAVSERAVAAEVRARAAEADEGLAEPPAAAARKVAPPAPGAKPKIAPRRVKGLRFVGPDSSIGEVLAARLARVHTAWNKQRALLPRAEASGFELALEQCDEQAKTGPKVEAMRCLDEFVRLAFDDREP